jgi:hypothetical protein
MQSPNTNSLTQANMKRCMKLELVGHLLDVQLLRLGTDNSICHLLQHSSEVSPRLTAAFTSVFGTLVVFAYRLRTLSSSFRSFAAAIFWMSFSWNMLVWQTHLHVRQSGMGAPLAMQSLHLEERMSPR